MMHLCNHVQQSAVLHKLLHMVTNYVSVYQIHQILIVWGAWMYKPSQDLFSGIDSLEYITRISSFYHYKNRELQRQKKSFWADPENWEEQLQS